MLESRVKAPQAAQDLRDYSPSFPASDALTMNVRMVRYGSPNAGREFTASLRETGFAVITGHPIAKELIDRTFAEWQRFFESESKHEHVFDPAEQAGFFPFRTENAKHSKLKDLKEFYHHYPDRKALPEVVGTYTPHLYGQLCKLGQELLSWVDTYTPAEVRGRFPLRLSEMIDQSEETLLRVLHYPGLSGSEEAGAIRAAAHEDINLITLLPAATAPGLEVKDTQGNWHSVACDPGMIVVNAGDMLQEASRGYYPSTTHQVINPSGPASRQPRFSMPLFLHPRRNAPLGVGMTAGEFLDDRLRAIGLK